MAVGLIELPGDDRPIEAGFHQAACLRCHGGGSFRMFQQMQRRGGEFIRGVGQHDVGAMRAAEPFGSYGR